MKHTRRLAALMLLVFTTIQPASLLAQATKTTSTLLLANPGFRADLILDDKDIFEIGGMNRDRIQEFLLSRGTLGTTRLPDIDGVQKPVADIIWRVATSYKINPKYLMALLQKEQSLIEDPSPTQKQLDWATGYGVCDSCAKNDPAIQDFKGFASQLEWAAKQHREKYLQQILTRGTTISGYAPGKQSIVDGQVIVPVNQATAMLYSYTPHISGNLNLWQIWKRWFGLTFTDGTVVKGRTSKQSYLISYGKKRAFKSQAALASVIDPNKVVLVEDSQLSSYEDGNPIAFANYSLIQADKKRYLIDGDKKRLILNDKVFLKLGFNEDELIDTKPEDLLAYVDGPDITLSTAYPTGLLAKDDKNAYWYIEGDIRHLIPNKSLVNLYFRSRPARTLTTKALSTFTIGDPYQIHNGELVRSAKKSDIYVIENGLRRPIPSMETFQEMGWNTKNIAVLPDALLETYPIGKMVDPYQNNIPLIQTASASINDSSTSP